VNNIELKKASELSEHFEVGDTWVLVEDEWNNLHPWPAITTQREIEDMATTFAICWIDVKAIYFNKTNWDKYMAAQVGVEKVIVNG